MKSRPGMRSSIRLAVVSSGIMLCWGCGASNCTSDCSCPPERLPLGSVNRAHYQAMETNAEAADFILYRNEFVGNTVELSGYGKDHLMEIAARASSAPFPVLVERSENNSDPDLDQRRRAAIIQLLSTCGIADAPQRTVVAPAYGKAESTQEAALP